MAFTRFMSDVYFRFSKWTFVVEEVPPPEGAILVGAPHTSNWDFVLMLALSGKIGRKLHWLGKDSLFKGPLRPIMRSLGGIPVDRSKRHGLVGDLVQRIEDEPGFILASTPKGTRGKRDYWRSGFYRIAEASGLPLALCFVDSSTKTTGLGPLLYVTGDTKADMDAVRGFYAGKVGIRPELTSEPRLRDEE